MADYNEQTLTSKMWQRACRIVIENPLGEMPTVNYVEEEVIQLPDGTTKHRLLGNLPFKFDDPMKLVTMINVETNEPTKETYPVGLAQWIIYSLYWQLATERDIKPIIVPKADPVEDQPTPSAAKGPTGEMYK